MNLDPMLLHLTILELPYLLVVMGTALVLGIGIGLGLVADNFNDHG